MTKNNPSQQECHKCNRERGTVPVRCDHHTVSQPEGWEKEFNSQWFERYGDDKDIYPYEAFRFARDFFSTTLSTLVKEMEKKESPIKLMQDGVSFDFSYREGFNAGISAAIEVVKKMGV